MKTGERGVRLISEFEGLELEAYPDPGTGGDPWTIGFGHTGDDVHPGLEITEERAFELLRKDLEITEKAVTQLAPVCTQNQFDALVSFTFNCGRRNLQTSTLLRLHNAGDYIGAAKQFVRWNKAAGRVMRGLTRRREAEAELYRRG